MNVGVGYQQAQPSRSVSRWILIGSLNSPLNSSASSCASALRAMTSDMISTRCFVQDWEKKNLTFKGLLNVDSLLGAGLEIRNVALGLAERHGPLRGDQALILLHIDLVTDDHLSIGIRIMCL